VRPGPCRVATMQTFVSLPATIQAFRLEAFQEVLPDGIQKAWGAAGRPDGSEPGGVFVVTAQGQRVYVTPGEWIAAEEKPGHFYPIAHDVFARRWDLPIPTLYQERAAERYFTASEHVAVVALRDRIVALAAEIDARVPDGRNKALALTALEDVQMRGNRGLFAPEHLR
jgi:hypothetical protein